MLYNKELYLKAYAKLYPNKGAMTPGVTPETADGMSTDKIDSIIEAIKYERYQWKPVKRTYIKKTNGKLRPLGLPMMPSYCTSYREFGDFGENIRGFP
jgi:retron-type reverse transcriptase